MPGLTAAQRRLLAEVRERNADGHYLLVSDKRRYRTVVALEEARLVRAEYVPLTSPAGTRKWGSAYRCDLPLNAAAKRRVRVRKSGGDDAYSWCVFLDGRAFVSGQDRQSATYYYSRLRRQIAAGAR